MLPSEESLRLVMFAPDGETLIGVSEGEPLDSPSAKKPLVEREKARRVIGPVKLTRDMLQVEPGQSDRAMAQGYLRVVGDEGLELKYTLKVEVIPPCFALQEQGEDNNTLERAVLPAQAQGVKSDTPMHICADDEDWMRVDVGAGETLFVDVVAGMDAETGRAPALEISLLEAAGGESLSAVEEVPSPQGMIYGVSLRDVPEAKTLWLRVRPKGAEQQGPYTVQVFRYPSCEAGGDDWLEQNDQASAPAEFPADQGPLRHLRVCPGDADWFKLQGRKEDRIALGLKHDALEPAPDGTPPGQVRFRLWNEAGDTITQEGQPVPAPPDGQPAPFQQVLTGEELKEEATFLLEIGADDGRARFYDLVPLNGHQMQPPQQQQQQQSDKQEPEDPQDPQDPQDPKDEQEAKQDEQEGQQPEDQPQEPQDPEAQEGEEEDPQEAREAQIEEILENLEESDDNFQLKRALENIPDRYIENDW
jgi:hypothetical protein